MGKIVTPREPFITVGNEIIPIRPKTKKVLIGMPIGRPMSAFPLECFINLIAHLARDPQYIVATKFTTSAYLDCNRNDIAKQGIKGESDYVLMIDSDMTYPDTVLDTLISRDKDVIGVVYYSIRSTRRVGPILYDYDPKKKLWKEWPKCDKEEPFRVCAIGTGIVLIKTKIFDKIEEPWFSFFSTKYRKTVAVMGEDIAFCLKCMAAGVEVWADPTMDIGHCKDYIYTKEDCGLIKSKWDAPYDDKERADRVFFQFDDIAKSFDITYFLIFGTCLGFYRDGDYIRGDNDIDIGLKCSVEKREKFFDKLKNNGFQLEMKWETNYHFIKDRILIDIWVEDPEIKNTNSFDELTYKGRKFKIPSNPEGHLERGYGNWKIPAKRKYH